MKNRLLVTLILTLGACSTGLLACGEEKQPGGQGSSCSSDASCQEGFQCVKTSTTERDLWQSCDPITAPCIEGLECIEVDGFMCEPPTPSPGEAGYGDDCEELPCVAPLQCETSIYEPGCAEMPDGSVDCPPVTTIYECEFDGEVTTTKSGSCQPKDPGAVGDHCQEDGDCEASLRCSDAITYTVVGFLEPCTEDGVICGDALSCDETSGTCMPDSPPENFSGWYQECASTRDCMDGLTCMPFEVPGEPTVDACFHTNFGEQSIRVCERIPGEGKLGQPCYSDSDCISLECLESEYGPPFCSRSCETVQEPCPAGPDAQESESLCISFGNLPDPNAPPFKGDLETFCVPRCSLDVEYCIEQNPNWEVCEAPLYLGDPLYPNLGTNYRVCQAPSFQGKDPVDPLQCNWEKTIGSFANEANICRKYCSYMETCKAIDTPPLGLACCEWGCFNRMVLDGEVNDPWYDEAKCYVETHFAFPDVGQQNSCNQPPVQCGGDPEDPTPPAASGG